MKPQVNIQAGACYLQLLQLKFNNDLFYTAASYNAGEDRVESWIKTRHHQDNHFFIEMIPFSETRGYVQKVIGNFSVYEWLL